jgi:Mn-dependent DtxR family transcriptional regulator
MASKDQMMDRVREQARPAEAAMREDLLQALKKSRGRASVRSLSESLDCSKRSVREAIENLRRATMSPCGKMPPAI